MLGGERDNRGAPRSRRRTRRGEREWGGGVPLPSRLEGLGERRKAENEFWSIWRLKKSHLIAHASLIGARVLVINMSDKFAMR